MLSLLITAFLDILIPLIALVAFGFSIYDSIRLRQIEKRLNDVEANSAFTHNMLVELDSKITIEDDSTKEN